MVVEEKEESSDGNRSSHKRKRHLPVEAKNPRRSQRERKKPVRLKDFVASVFSSSTSSISAIGLQVPLTWDEMMASPQCAQWLEATKEVFLAQRRDGTWVLVPSNAQAQGARSLN
ncbi:hypothetical protein PI125_g5293 [Phytophthora idaei]|nr:hypothetical protein PI125_g5293 [Phytophthora idaei]